MAEMGLVASVVSHRRCDLRLSITLYTFSKTLAIATKSIQSIAKDISLTSAVLEALGANLKQGEQVHIVLWNGAQDSTDCCGFLGEPGRDHRRIFSSTGHRFMPDHHNRSATMAMRRRTEAK